MKKATLFVLFLCAVNLSIAKDSTNVSKRDFDVLNARVYASNPDFYFERENALIKDVYGKMIDTIGISVAIAALILTGLSIFCAVLYTRTSNKINKNIKTADNYKKDLDGYKSIAKELKKSHDELTQKLNLLYNEVTAQKILLYAERLRRENKFKRAFDKVNEGISFIQSEKFESKCNSLLLSFVFEKANINLAKLNYKEALDCFLEIDELDTEEERHVLQICEASLFSYDFETYKIWICKIDKGNFTFEYEYFNCLYYFISSQFDEFGKTISKLRGDLPHLDSYHYIDWDFTDYYKFIKKHSLRHEIAEFDRYNNCLKRLNDLVIDFQLKYSKSS